MRHSVMNFNTDYGVHTQGFKSLTSYGNFTFDESRIKILVSKQTVLSAVYLF